MYTLYGPSSEAPFTRDLYCFTISVRGGRGTTLATIMVLVGDVISATNAYEIQIFDSMHPYNTSH